MKKERKELLYNFINCGLAGLLVFLGGLTAGNISQTTVVAALLAAGITAGSQFKEYWQNETEQATKRPKKIMSFL